MSAITTFFSKERFLVVVVLCAAMWVRFYKFEERITFGPEQGMSLITSGDYLKERFTLLGQRFFRTTSDGKTLFGSPIFNYSLALLQLIFNFDPVLITGFFAVLNWFTGIVIFMVFKKLFGREVAFFGLVLFAFNNYMVFHSMFIWVLDWAPLLGVCGLYIFFLFQKTNYLKYSALLGIITGLLVGLDYYHLFPALILFGLVVAVSKNRVTHGAAFVLGAILSNFPTVLFDIRHGFYHIRTLFQYGWETLANPAQSNLNYYHFLFLWPVLVLLSSFCVKAVYKWNKGLCVLLCLIYVVTNLKSSLVNFSKPVGMIDGMNESKFRKAAQIIAEDDPKDFNVAALLDFDSRAYPIRYLLRFTHDYTSGSVEDYPRAKNLYVFAESNYDFDKAIAWEIKSFQPFNQVWVKNVSQNFSVYKLSK